VSRRGVASDLAHWAMQTSILRIPIALCRNEQHQRSGDNACDYRVGENDVSVMSGNIGRLDDDPSPLSCKMMPCISRTQSRKDLERAHSHNEALGVSKPLN
jgi:hypothetical protein